MRSSRTQPLREYCAGFLLLFVGLLMPPSALAINLADNGQGELAIVPYYTVRDGWQTLMQLTNTSDKSIAVKMRVHEALNGRISVDFVVILAPHDVFPGVLREGPDGPVFVGPEGQYRTCTIPTVVGAASNGVPLYWQWPDSDGGTTDDVAALDRVREGFVSLQVMGYTEGEDLGSQGGTLETYGDAAASSNCRVLQEGFEDANILQTARQFGEPINALNVRFSLLHAQRGIEAGMDAVIWANAYNRSLEPNAPLITPEDNAQCRFTRSYRNQDGHLSWFPDGRYGSCRNLVAAQTTSSFRSVSLDDIYPPVAQGWQTDGNWPSYAQSLRTLTRPDLSPDGLESLSSEPLLYPSGIDALSLTIMRSAIAAEFSEDRSKGLNTDWIVTFPTKAFYVDDGSGIGSSGPGENTAINEIRYGVYDQIPQAPVPPFSAAFGHEPRQWGYPYVDGGACEEMHVEFYSRDGDPPETGGVTVLLPPTPPQNLCHQVGAVVRNGYYSSYDLSTLGARVSWDASYTLHEYSPRGWLRLSFTNAMQAIQIDGPLAGTTQDYVGLPVIGFAIKERNFGDISKNYADMRPLFSWQSITNAAPP